MLSTPEADIPVPLSKSDEKKDALEQLRDSQEATLENASALFQDNTPNPNSFLSTSFLSSDDESNFFTSWFQGLDDNSSEEHVVQRVTSDGAHPPTRSANKWVEFTPQKSATSLVSTPGRTAATAETSGDELIVNIESDVKQTVEKDEDVAGAARVTPDKKNDGSSDDKKTASISVSNKKSTSQDTDRHEEASKGAVAVGGAAAATVPPLAKSSATADTPTRAVQKNLKKKAFHWFRKRQKDGDGSSEALNKDPKSGERSHSSKVPLKSTPRGVNNSSAKNETGAVDENKPTPVTPTKTDITSSASKAPETSQQIHVKQDIVGELRKDDQVMIAHAASNDSADTHVSVTKDIVGVVEQNTVIAHVVSTDSADSHVRVRKDVVGIVDSSDRVADAHEAKHVSESQNTANAPNINKVASIVERIEKGLSGDSSDKATNDGPASAGTEKMTKETSSTTVVPSVVEDTTSNNVRNTSNKWAAFDDDNEFKQQGKVDAAPKEADSIVVSSTTRLLPTDETEKTDPTNDEKATLSKDETLPAIDKQDHDNAAIPVVAATTGALIAAAAVGDNKEMDHEARNSSRMSIFRRLGSPKRKTSRKGVEDAEDGVTASSMDDKELTTKSTAVYESLAKDKQNGVVKEETDVVTGAAVASSATAPAVPTEPNHVKRSENDTRTTSVSKEAEIEGVVVGAAVAAEAVPTVESGTTTAAAAAMPASKQEAEKAAKKKAFQWFGLRRSHSEKGLNTETADDVEIDKDETAGTGKDERETRGIKSEEKGKASDWTSFDDKNVFSGESGSEGDALAATVIPSSSENDAQSRSEYKVNNEEKLTGDDMNRERDTVAAAAAATGIGVVAVDMADSPVAKNDEANQVLMEKASRWFGLRRSNSEKAIKKDAVDTATENDDAAKSEGDDALNTTSDWADFDSANVFKADRASHDSLTAAAAIPLPHDGPDELCASKDFQKDSSAGMNGDSRVAPAVAGAAAVGVAMGGDENAGPPSEDGIIEYFDEEAQSLTEPKKSLRSHCKCSRRCKIFLVLLAHLVACGIVLGIVLPMVLNGFWFETNDEAASPSVEPVPTDPLVPVEPAPTTPGSPEPTAALVDPTPDSVEQTLDQMLSSVSFDGGSALRTPFTAQSVAYNWLKNNAFLQTYSDVKRIQRYSLATLYYSSSGDSWDNKTGWLSDQDECTWFNTALGGFCSDDGSVVELDMMYNGMEGAIPEEIALLPLRELNLAGNNLVGPLPTTLGQMTSLVDVVLWGNKINGTLPSEIGLMVGLETLDLPMNDLTGSIPTEVGLMTSLDWLSISNNDLNGTIPSEINAMTNLNNFYAYNNNLDGTFTCSQTITQCWISCRSDDDACRGL